MSFSKILCSIALLVVSFNIRVECRSYNNGLIFYNLENHNYYLPPTISVSRGRSLAKYNYSPRGSIWSTFGKPCECQGPVCGCCVGIQVKQYNFDQKMCANVSFAVPKDEIQLEVFLNDTATAKYGIAARNPSPLCIPIMMGIPMSMCIQMSNIGVQGDNLNMCMDFLVRLASTELFEMHFQCMKVGLQGAGWVGADGQPVIPASGSKIKIKSSYESEDYYDESEAEQDNEITSQDADKESDENKAEEELDNNDITEKLMDIVKETEQEVLSESTESIEDNKLDGLSPMLDHKKVGEIVTNIMESINKGNAADAGNTLMETPHEMSEIKDIQNDTENSKEMSAINKAEKNKIDSVDKVIGTNELEEVKSEMKIKETTNKIPGQPLENDLESLNLESNEIIEISTSTANLPSDNELLFEGLLTNSQTNQMVENSQMSQSQERETSNNNKPELELEKTTSEYMSNDLQATLNDKSDMSFNTNDAVQTIEINKTDNELENSLEQLQLSIQTTTEHLLATNLKPTMTQNTATTSEIVDINTVDKITSTTTNKPANLDNAVAATFMVNTDGVDNKNINDNDQDEHKDNENGDDDNDDDDAGNSHENDSDYDEEESGELEDKTAEKEIESSNATTIGMPNVAATSNKIGISHQESLNIQKQAIEFDSNESHSKDETNENTDDELVMEEAEYEDNSDEENQDESNEQLKNTAAEEDYDEDYEDYETTTVITNNQKINSHKHTCCKSTTSTVSNSTQATNEQQLDDNNHNNDTPDIVSAPSSSLQSVSSNNSKISTTDNLNMLNVESTTNKVSQNISGSTVATVAPTASTTSSEVMPLPMARKLYSFQHHQKQQHRQQSRQSHYYV